MSCDSKISPEINFRHQNIVNEKIRQQLICEAARLLYRRQVSDYRQAKIQAARRLFRSWIKSSELPSDEEIQQELQRLSSDYQTEPAPEISSDDANRFQLYRSLLAPLDRVNQPSHSHPEGDVLYHSLQVYELAYEELPYDEEFLLAALLHDVGKGIDSRNHIVAGLQALGNSITLRTAWLIEHHADARLIREGTIGARLNRRLRESDSFDELVLLEQCDRLGRQPGAQVRELEIALNELQELAQENDV